MEIGHDGKGMGAGWHLEYVQVEGTLSLAFRVEGLDSFDMTGAASPASPNVPNASINPTEGSGAGIMPRSHGAAPFGRPQG